MKLEGIRIISAEREYFFAVLEADAKTANRPLDELAEEYLQKIKMRSLDTAKSAV